MNGRTGDVASAKLGRIEVVVCDIWRSLGWEKNWSGLVLAEFLEEWRVCGGLSWCGCRSPEKQKAKKIDIT